MHDRCGAGCRGLPAERGRLLAAADARGCTRAETRMIFKRRHRLGTPGVLRHKPQRSADPDYTPGRFEPGHAAARAARVAASENVSLNFVTWTKRPPS